MSAAARWADALLAAALFGVDPQGLVGISVRAAPGPVRERWLAALRQCLPSATALRRVPAHVTDDRLLGGLDLARTLATGRPAVERGLLAASDGGVLLLAMAERMSSATAARIAAVLDSGEASLHRDGFALTLPARIGVVLLDEGCEDDERPPPALLDRAAFALDLHAIAWRDAEDGTIDGAAIARARARLPQVRLDDALLESVCAATIALGIASPRAAMLAVRAARAAAALDGRDDVTADDAACAARLVLAPRATQLPPPDPDAGEDAAPPEPADDARDPAAMAQPRALDDVVLEAAQAAIPPGLLAALQARLAAGARAPVAGRAGAAHIAAARGRAIGVRAGPPRSGARLNVLATLRAAAPWQRLRQTTEDASRPARIAVRRDDFRVTRYRQHSHTTTIFVVDASGSSALHRLAEAKGAVQLLLADCYVRRDNVALLAFRGRDAQLLLPPTRSLVRAKRMLASLPGGGGTPLAAGIDAAVHLADAVRRRGQSPLVVLLTDGRANVARDGRGGRAGAEQDALAAAAGARLAGIRILLVDTSPHPQPHAHRLAQAMDARYLPLPQAGPAALTAAVRQASAPRDIREGAA